ncbi:MAG TPA: Ig-like domain-containing protein [Anaerolineae bacterium]|nr:Ig-like domain-containing protein [Anaerolineae bacterium]
MSYRTARIVRIGTALAVTALVILTLSRCATASSVRVIEWSPGVIDDAPINAPISLTFDQRMDADSIAAAFHIRPAVSGRFVATHYEPPSTLQSPLVSAAAHSPLASQDGPFSVIVFLPDRPLEKATQYQIAVDASVRSQSGQTLREPFTAAFTTTGQLHVGFYPAIGKTNVPTGTAIGLSFNAPFSATGQVPIFITPPVTGAGRWLSSRRYEFEPSALQPATRYTVRLPAGLRGPGGEKLLSDAVTTFTTTLPAVADHAPDGYLVAPSTAVTLTFNLPVDPASVESRFAMRGMDRQTISGTLAWVDDQTLVFTPADRLLEGETYSATVANGIRTPLGDLPSAQPFTYDFRIAPKPELVSSSPSDGDLKAAIGDRVTLRFNVPMDSVSVERALRIEPAVAEGEPRFEWDTSHTRLDIVYNIDPTALYTLALGDEARDFLNRPLTGNRSIVFQAGPQEAVTWLVGPRGYWNNVYGTYNPNPQVRQYTQFRNVEQITYRLSSITRKDFLSAFRPNWYWDENKILPASTPIFTWTQAVSAPLNALAFATTDVTLPDGSPLPSGAYLLETDGMPGHSEDWRVLVVSPLNLALKRSERQLFVWATDLRTGQPVSGLSLTVYDQDKHLVTSGATNQVGVFITDQLPECFDRWECAYGWRPLYVVAEAESGEWGFVASEWDEGIATRDFRMPYYYGEPSHTVFLYTDRPIYRPGQTVYFKGVVRADDDGRYRLPAFSRVPVVIQDAQGNEIFREELPLTDVGTLYGEFTLSAEAALGSYSVQVRHAEDEPPAYGNFRVAEYRKPEFKVSVTPNTTTPLHGEAVTVVVQADYYFGAPLPNAAVEWRLSSEDYLFSLPGAWYSFGDVDEYYWLWGEESDSGQNIYANGTGRTDVNGTFTFTVPIDLSQAKRGQVLTFEADVVDANHQVTSARGYAVAHKSALYVGARPRWYVTRPNNSLEIQLVAADPGKNRLPGMLLTVELYDRVWKSVRVRDSYGTYHWNSTSSDTLISTQVVTTGVNGEVGAVVVPPRGGSYRVVARGKDVHGVESVASTFFWTWGGEYVNWGIQNDDRISVIADKRTYQPGETAHLLITAPFADSTALVSVERGGVLRYWTLPIKSTSALIDVPIHADYAPNAFVSVILIKGQAPDFPAADFKIGYAALNVELTEQRLNVELIPDKTRYAPRDTALYIVRVTDHLGQPVDAEVSLSLIDAAVLALVGDEDRDILTAFYRQRGLGVHNSLTLVTSVDRLTAILDKKAKGGGGGGEVTERDLFADTAFWRAAVRTGPAGETTVSVPLPDNLTTWRMRAKAVSTDTQLGQTEVDVIATQDFVLRPVLPRFFTVGDQAQVGAIVHNYTPITETLNVSLDFAGRDDFTPQQITIGPNGSAPAYWNVSVPRTLSVTVRLQAVTADGRGDAVRLPLPVNAFFDRVSYSNYRSITGTQAIPIALPPDVDRNLDELVIEVEPTLAASIDSGLEYLIGFPYGCVEQTMSSFLPDVVVMRLIQQVGIDTRPDFREQLSDMIESGMQRLYGYQHNDGGWGWWKDDDSNPAITAYVLYGLHQMELGGRPIDAKVRDAAVSYLLNWLQRTSVDAPIGPTHGADAVSSGANVRAYALYVLAELGHGNPGLTGRLYEQRDKLDPYGKAYLALALYLTNDRAIDARIETLVQELRDAAKKEGNTLYWEDRQRDYWGMSTSVRSTAIAIDALVRLFIEDPTIDPAARWLLMQRQEGRWNTTQETSLSLAALTDYVVSTFEREGNFTYTVRVNGQVVATESVTPQTLGRHGKWVVPLANLGAGDPVVEIARGEGPGAPLRVSVSLRHYRAGDDIAPIDNHGVHVTRTYSKPLDHLRPGDVVSVTLNVRFDDGGTYVLVEDPLPAGWEPIDASLATTSQQFQGRSGDWVWTHVELRDDRVALFATWIPGGHTYTYTYRARVTTAGRFYALPMQAYAMYSPDIVGRTPGTVMQVSER